jgi:uncharacterized ion transporter superfamily protein YfcC
MSRSRFRVPHTLALIFGMILVAQVLTYVLPHGEFEHVAVDEHKYKIVPGTYEVLDESDNLAPWSALTAVPRGFKEAEGIIFFVFIIGGAFGVFRATGAADALIGALLRRFGDKPSLLIVGGLLIFSFGSSTIGMAEEYLPFVPMLLALCVALGYDSVTAVGIMCVGYGTGYGVAIMNPFTLIIAQNVAGLEETSGMGFRLILWVVFLAIGLHHVLRYANKVRQDPSKSLVADIEQDGRHRETTRVPLTGVHVAVLVAIGLALAALIWGLKTKGWYLVEMGALFVGLTLILGLVSRLGIDRTAKEFCSGAAELTTTALLIGFARTIQVVLDEGKIIDTIIHGIAGPLQSVGSHGAAVGMFAVQSVFNFFVPSGSGQAYITMPLMAPLSDLVGVSRQVAVLAYQFGDGFTNILIPTNAVLIGILTMAQIPYERWLRFVLPFMIKVWIVGSLALVVAVAIGYS